GVSRQRLELIGLDELLTRRDAAHRYRIGGLLLRQIGQGIGQRFVLAGQVVNLAGQVGGRLAVRLNVGSVLIDSAFELVLNQLYLGQTLLDDRFDVIRHDVFLKYGHKKTRSMAGWLGFWPYACGVNCWKSPAISADLASASRSP